MTNRDTIPITIHIPPGLARYLNRKHADELYEWSKNGNGPRPTASSLIIRYCQEGWLRDELAQAADQIDTDPDALNRIQQKIRNQP